MQEEQKEARSAGRERQARAGRANITLFNERRSGKPAMQHGIHTVINSDGGELPQVPNAAEIAASVDAVVGEMVSDLGGESELTAQRRAIIESQRMCLLVLGLTNSYLRREGLLSDKGKPHPLLATVVSFANCLRLNGAALGLDRRTKDATPTLERYLAERYGKPDAAGNSAEAKPESTQAAEHVNA